MKISRKWRRAWNRSKPAFMLVISAAIRQRNLSKRQQRPQDRVAKKRFGLPRAWKKAAAAAVLSFATLAGTPNAQAMPSDGQVVAGQGTISQNGQNMTVNQATDKLAINWQSFGIGSGEKVQFFQPSVHSVALNRVVGNDASRIFGQLTSNGQVFLVNPSGILFAPGSQVNVGGLVASTLSISDQDFMADRYSFNNSARAGTITNQGTITAADSGYVALFAPQVANEGVILARQGSVALAAGDKVSLDFSGDGLINVTVDQAAVNAQVSNKKLIQADGGLVVMTTKAAGELTASAVNNSGILSARSLGMKNGKIVLDGGDTGWVQAGGTLDASGTNAAGGNVAITGQTVSLNGDITVNGLTGGSITAKAGDNLEQSGKLNATGSDAGGQITLSAGRNLIQTTAAKLDASGGSAQGGSIGITAGNQMYSSAAMNATGAAGGSIRVSGDTIRLMGASADASGTRGNGGTISVGGGWQGTEVDGKANADVTIVGPYSLLKADGAKGSGGRITVWSGKETAFGGKLSAYGALGGAMEVSSGGHLLFAGEVAKGQGKAASLLLDPKNITIDDTGNSNKLQAFSLVDPNPDLNPSMGYNGNSNYISGNQFGHSTLELSTGNIVVTSPFDDYGGIRNSGAVYLFDGTTHGVISTLRGSHTNDGVGSGSFMCTSTGQFASNIIALSNGNFVIASPDWNGFRGAVTWGSGLSGWGSNSSATVDGSNSLIGTAANDRVGYFGVRVLPGNGNYVVVSPLWNQNRGAATWGDGTKGVVGEINALNSLIGSNSNDNVGGITENQNDKLMYHGDVIVLPNGNYVVNSANWNSKSGAVTWGSGTTGVTGEVSNLNSLVGVKAGVSYSDPVFDKGGDHLGAGGDKLTDSGIKVLADSDYLVVSPGWNNSYGAVTRVSGADGKIDGGNSIGGIVTTANSLTGSYYGDRIGSGGVTLLSSGDFVVSSPTWNVSRGAVTWVNGTTRLTYGGTRIVSAANSLVGGGEVSRQNVGSGGVNEVGVKEVADGNYVVISQFWSDSSSNQGGAVTWSKKDGSTVGAVSTQNSLYGIGGSAGYQGDRVVVLSNGNYVVISPEWMDTSGTLWKRNVGAVTWVDGHTGRAYGATGPGTAVTAQNSLVGSKAYDMVGSGGVIALTGNGSYVVGSPSWDRGNMTDAGAATWGKSDGSTVGEVSFQNSLVGSADNQKIGDKSNGLTIVALTNGNYVVANSEWNNGTGAVTWGNGTVGVSGESSSQNSLTGKKMGDFVGGGGAAGVVALNNGNYVVVSRQWSPGMYIGLDQGAVTWVDGSTGKAYGESSIGATVSKTNSLTGNRIAGDGVIALANGDYLVKSSAWNNSRGAITWIDGKTGIAPGETSPGAVVSASNSFTGERETITTGTWPNMTTVQVGDAIGNFSLVAQQLADGSVLLADKSFRSYIGSVHILKKGGAGQTPGGRYQFGDNPGEDVTITAGALTSILNTGTALTLQANTDITVNSDITVNDTAGDGGSLTMQAGRSINLNANITTDNGKVSLTANDPNSIAAHRDNGKGGITMATGKTIDAGTGAVTMTVGDGGEFGNVTLGDITAGSLTVSGRGSTIIGGNITVATGDVTIRGMGDMAIQAGKKIAATNGNIYLDNGGQGGKFINNSGADALQAGSGKRWMVYSSSPENDIFGGLASGNKALWNKTYDGYSPDQVTQSGSRYLFSYSPTVTFTSKDASKTKGKDASATVSNAYTVTGVVNNTYGGAIVADTSADAFSGTPGVTSPGAAASADIGDYAISINKGTVLSETGYTLKYESKGILAVTNSSNPDSKSYPYPFPIPNPPCPLPPAPMPPAPPMPEIIITTPNNPPGGPGASPGQPGGEPDQPNNQPGQPGGPPGQPSGEPEQPVVTPGGELGEPGGTPAQPSGEPGQPGGTPSTPKGEPSQPSGIPGTSNGEPGQPEVTPRQPSGEPGQPGGIPGQPDGELGQPAGEPGQPSSEASQEGGTPGTHSGEPGQAGRTLVTPNGEPGQPGGTPVAPSVEPGRPGGTPRTPSGEFGQPGGAPGTPSSEPGQLVGTLGQPSQPGGAPRQPNGETSESGETPGQAKGEPGQPGGTYEQPSGETGQRGGVSGDSGTQPSESGIPGQSGGVDQPGTLPGGSRSQTNQIEPEIIRLSSGTSQPKDYTIMVEGDSVTLSQTDSGVVTPVAANYKGSLAVLTVGAHGTQLEGHYNVAYTGASLNLTPGTQSSQSIPVEPAEGVVSSVFSLSTPGGAVAVFGLFYTDRAISINSMNQEAAAIAAEVGGNRNLVVASALLAAQDKLGVGLDTIIAAYIHQ